MVTPFYLIEQVEAVDTVKTKALVIEIEVRSF
jgi:hypothetical protein